MDQARGAFAELIGDLPTDPEVEAAIDRLCAAGDAYPEPSHPLWVEEGLLALNTIATKWSMTPAEVFLLIEEGYAQAVGESP